MQGTVGAGVGPPSFYPCMWHLCHENSMAPGAFIYPGVLVLWLEEETDSLLTVQLWAKTSPLWARFRFCKNKDTEEVSEDCPRDSVCWPLSWLGMKLKFPSLLQCHFANRAFFLDPTMPTSSLLCFFHKIDYCLKCVCFIHLLLPVSSLKAGIYVWFVHCCSPHPWHIVGACQ